jgi:hypothetical protein
MKVSLLTAIHDKPPETLLAVLGAMKAQEADQLVMVRDRPTPEAREATATWMLNGGASAPVHWVDLTGPPGWRSPCISFNAGLEAVTGDILVLNHSDIVHTPGNLAVVKAHFAEHSNSVLFGMVVESEPSKLEGAGNAGPLLMGTGNPRPLTWLMALQTKDLRAIGGWDLAYMQGVCYEDDDLTARLWKSGLDFHFVDAFAAVHQTHSRAYFTQYRTAANMTTFVNRYGSASAADVVRKSKPIITKAPGRLTWKHA